LLTTATWKTWSILLLPHASLAEPDRMSAPFAHGWVMRPDIDLNKNSPGAQFLRIGTMDFHRLWNNLLM
jgi:hypothetical protein